MQSLPVVLAALAVVVPAQAAGGNYVLDGGTQNERAQVRAALNVSSFDWGVVSRQVTVHIAPNVRSKAAPGEIWLDSNLLDSGRFSWAFVQHEYAHQVDFALFEDPLRAQLNSLLGGKDWWYGIAGLTHSQFGCERFASTLAWAYWPSKHNALRPHSARDESGAMKPRKFRALMKRLLADPSSFA